MAKVSNKALQETIEDFRNEYKQNHQSLKDEIILLKNTVIKNLLDDNKRLRNKIKELEEKQNDNSNLLVEVESQSQSLEQYTRRNNIEIDGIPEEVTNENLEGKVVEILNSVDIDISSFEIEACHRLPLPKKSKKKRTTKSVIVRFSNRKFAEEVCCKTT